MHVRPKDRDFVETGEGFFFCIVGYLHPPDKVTAYLKYVPSREGRWGRGVRYQRVLDYYHAFKVYEAMPFLERNFPQYVHFCPVRHIKISMVPRGMIKRYYSCQARLQEIMTNGYRDRLEAETFSLSREISELSGVDVRDLGVTGSILIGIHNPAFSDIDLTVHGLSEALQVRRALTELRGRHERIKPPPREKILEWTLKFSRIFGLDPRSASILANRRWNYMVFNRRFFSIHPIRKDEEITETYGEKIYYPVGVAEGEATVEDSGESLFLPAIYRVKEVELKAGGEYDVREIVSFEGAFSGIAYEGERVAFRGKLERVESKAETYYRVVLGTAEVKDNYIVPVV